MSPPETAASTDRAPAFARVLVPNLIWFFLSAIAAGCVAFAANLYLEVVASNGWEKLPEGSIAIGSGGIGAPMFWSLGSAVLFGVIGFWHGAGTRCFLGRVVRFPIWLGRGLRRGAALRFLVFGIALGLVTTDTYVRPWLSLVVAVALVALAPSPIIAMPESAAAALGSALRRVFRRSGSVAQAVPLSILLIGAALAFAYDFMVARDPYRLWAAGLCLLFVVLYRAPRPRATASLFWVAVGGSVALDWLLAGATLAHDGGLVESGGSWRTWYFENEGSSIAIEHALDAFVHAAVPAPLAELAGRALGRAARREGTPPAEPADANARAVKALQGDLDNADLAVRRAAAGALGALGAGAAVAKLALVLERPREGARDAAANALARLPTEDASAAIVQGLGSPGANARRALLGAVERCFALDAERPLPSDLLESMLGCADHADRVVRETTLTAFDTLSRVEEASVGRREGLAAAVAAAGRRAEAASPEALPGFTVYHPMKVTPERWYSLLAYVHVPGVAEAVDLDSRRTRRETAAVDVSASEAAGPVETGSPIVVVPELDGCEFNPPEVEILWLEDWQRVEFRLRASAGVAGFEPDATMEGRVSFRTGGALLGETPIWAEVSPHEGELPPRRARRSAFQSFFLSYSHEDSEVVDELKAALERFGTKALRDVDILRSGERWRKRIKAHIENADVFQLCWSAAASRSREVEREWRHALALDRDFFIRPLYWRKPPVPPPEELEPLHFAYWERPGSPTSAAEQLDE